MPPVLSTERIPHLQLRQETAALQDFGPAYDGFGSKTEAIFDARISASASYGHACHVGLGR